MSGAFIAHGRGVLPGAARRCILGVLAAALAACSLTTKFAPPQLTVAGVQIVSASLWEQRFRVRLHVRNPNDRALAVERLEYALEVEGQPFASGSTTASFVVPPLGETEFDTDVTTDLAGTLLPLLSRAGGPGQSLAYRLTGRLLLSQGLLRSIPFEQSGRFSLQ
jgi:Late embryogenesis abundant protein